MPSTSVPLTPPCSDVAEPSPTFNYPTTPPTVASEASGISSEEKALKSATSKRRSRPSRPHVFPIASTGEIMPPPAIIPAPHLGVLMDATTHLSSEVYVSEHQMTLPLPDLSPTVGLQHEARQGLVESFVSPTLSASLPDSFLDHSLSLSVSQDASDSMLGLLETPLWRDELDMEFDLTYDSVLIGSETSALSLDNNKSNNGNFQELSHPVVAISSNSSSACPRPAHTPRPPNAWILYRSDKLRAIAAGEILPELDTVMVEAGLSTSASGGSASEADKGPETVPAAPVKMKKGKKGSKQPTEHMLSLGRGKAGRGLPQADISKMISMLWKRESSEVRGRYERLSEQKKREHQEKYPGYKFQPVRKESKIAARVERQRKKDEKKRENDVASASASRSRRRKARLSPSSPYSVGVDGQSSTTPMSRSFSYSGPTDIVEHDQWIAPPKSEDGFDRRRRYPFPFPPNSVPAMRPEDHVDNPYLNSPQMFGCSIQSGEPTQVPVPFSPFMSISMPESSHMALARQEWTDAPPAHFVPPIQDGYSNPVDFQSAWSHQQHANEHSFSAVPYIFQPIPLPDDMVQLAIPEVNEPDNLAALWCLIEEESSPSAPAIPVNQPIDLSVNQGMTRWHSEASSGPKAWVHLEAPLGYYAPPPPVSTLSVAQHIVSDWSAGQLSNFSTDFIYGFQGHGEYQVSFQPQMVSAMQSHGPGPALSSFLPLSPVEAYSAGRTAGRTPQDQPPHPAHSVNSNSRTIPSPTIMDGPLPVNANNTQDYTGESQPQVSEVVPEHLRHVLKPNLPLSGRSTPLSFDPAALLVLRTPSNDMQELVGLNEVMDQMVQEVSPQADELVWNDNEKGFLESPTSPAFPLSPAYPASPVSPAPQEAVDTSDNVPAAKFPPRGSRRARIVAAKYDPLP